jgi:hypothetical protein
LTGLAKFRVVGYTELIGRLKADGALGIRFTL